MKILHTADWHIGQFKGPVVDGVNLRSQDTVKCLEYMVDVAIKERPDIVCISGDIFHQEQIGPVRYSDEMIHATNIITSLAHFAGYVIVMRGTPNHDGSGQFRVLKRMLLNVNNVCVVTEPFVIKTKYADIACIPGFDKQEFRAKFPGLSADEENLAWTKYISDMVFALRAECEKTPILMAHYTVPGCNMESGQTSFLEICSGLESMELWNWIQKRNSPNREKSWLRKKKLSESKRILSNPKEIRNLNSLAVILALSEIKATAAGIQLGMLFIDEPPFLDDEGAQAYVDALETIRDRYSDVKIMAITHDDAMKARFGQAVTVIKTDDGSKVIY